MTRQVDLATLRQQIEQRQREAAARLHASPMWQALLDAEWQASCLDCNDGTCVRCGRAER